MKVIWTTRGRRRRRKRQKQKGGGCEEKNAEHKKLREVRQRAWKDEKERKYCNNNVF